MHRPQQTLTAFRTSIAAGIKPPALEPPLEALWLAASGDWHGAHTVAQDISSPYGARIHAYLHRMEGDEPNARYWYRQAGEPFPKLSLEEEWLDLVEFLLGH